MARKSDYMGAVITASPAWVRPTEKSVLDSAEYVQHTQLLHCSFDIEEGARLLLPCMDHLSENNSPVSPHGKIYGGGGGMGGGRPNMPYGSYTQQQQQASLSAQAPTFQPNWGPSHIPGAVAGVVPTPMQSHMGVGGGAGQFYGQGMNMGHQQQVRQQHSPPPPMMTSPMMHYKQAGSAPLSMPPSPSGYGMPQQHQHQGAISSFGYHPAAVPTPGMYGQPQQQQQASAYGHPHLSQQQQQMSMPMPMQGVYSAPIMHGMNGYAQSPMQQLQQRMYQDNVYAHHAPQQPVAQQQQQQHMLNAGYAASSSVPSAYASAGQMSRPPQPPQMSPQYPMHKQQQQQPLRPLSSGAYSAQGNHPPHHAQLQQQGRPFDPAAAALAAAAEARYPVGQLVSSQTYDPKGRKYEAAPLSGRQSDYHSSGNVSARSDYRSPYPVPDDRFASGNVSARTNNETPRYQSSEERFGSGNASARTNTETPRYQQAHDMPQLSMQMQQLSTGDRYHSTGNLSARPDSSRETPRFVSMEDRYAKPTDPRPPTEDHRYHSAGNMSARMGSVEGPRYPSQQQQQQVLLLQPQQQQHERNINSRFNVQGSLTARPSEGSNSSRYPASEVDLLTTGSLSARYPSVEERYLQSAQPAQRQQPLQQQQEVFNAPAPPSSDRFVPRLDLDRSEAPVVPAPNPTSATGSVNSRPSALQQSLKLDLQPKFAEDRYALSAADPPVNAASTAATVSAAHAAPGSARTEEQRAIVPPPINIGNLSARRTTTEFSTLVSPRTALSDNARSSLLSSQNLQPLQSDYNEEHYQKPHKSPVVPLIPLEGISSLNSSASSSESNALYSDRSSLYMSTARSDAFGDTARSTIVPAGTVGGSSVYGLPGTGRSTATHHQLLGLSALTSSGLHNSAPNTARSARSVEFDLRRDGGSSGDSEDDYKPFAATAAGGALSGGLTLTSRSRDEVFTLTDRSTDAPHTNRLGYMGLDDLRNRRNAAGGAGGMSFLKGNNNTINEFDEMMERLNSESRSNSQCQSQHSNNRSPVGGDFAPNTARSGHSGHSGGSRRASNASIGIPQEVHEFGIFASSLTPRGLTPRRESIGSSSSGNGSGGGGSGHASSSCNVSGYNSNSTPVPAELKELGLTEQPEGGSYSLGLAAEHSEISDSSVAQKTPSSYLQMIFDNDSKVAPSDLE